MIERFELNQDLIPNIPCPHDCVIKKILHEGDVLTLIFEEDISYHDSIKYYHPKAKSLIIRYHLIEDFFVYRWKEKILLFNVKGFLWISEKKFFKMTRGYVTYGYHTIGYQSMMIKIEPNLLLDIEADTVEYEWIE